MITKFEEDDRISLCKMKTLELWHIKTHDADSSEKKR